MPGLTGWHALILLAIVVLIFGAAKLPALAKSVGQSMKIFKNEIKTDDKPTKHDVDQSGITQTNNTSSFEPQVNHTSPEVQAQADTSRNTFNK